MKLGPGQSTGEQQRPTRIATKCSLVIEGQLSAEIDGKRSLMKVGDFVSIPPRTKAQIYQQKRSAGGNFQRVFATRIPPRHEGLGAPSPASRPRSDNFKSSCHRRGHENYRPKEAVPYGEFRNAPDMQNSTAPVKR